jgi:pimeloyl-ACP methyl ester carboxylesterase
MLTLTVFSFLAWTAQLPKPSGKYSVGTSVTLLTDPSRRDLLHSGQSRTILVQYWYPARHAGNPKLAPYMSSDLLEALRADKYLNIDVVMLNGWEKIRTHSFLNAKAFMTLCPLLLFSPGMGMSRASYTTIAEQLASDGILVCIIDHPYCGLSIYSDGKLRSYLSLKTKPEEMVRMMSADQSFLISALSKNEITNIKFNSHKIFVGGHSIGGAAALHTGRNDSRVAGCIDLDGDVWGEVEKFGTRKPFVTLLNEPGPPIKVSQKMREERRDEWTGVLGKSPKSAVVLTLRPTYHFTFSDIPFLLPASELQSSGATLAPLRGRDTICGVIGTYMTQNLVGVRTLIKRLPEIRIQSKK